MISSYLIVLFAGLISLISPLVWRLVLIKSGVFDIPNHRSSHSQPTIRGGGVALLTALVMVLPLIFLSTLDGAGRAIAIAIVSSVILASVIGLYEDLKGISSKFRALCQSIVGMLFCIFLGFLEDTIWVFLPVAILFFVANVNFTNFMDGINGISSLHGFCVGLVFSIIGFIAGVEWLVFAGLLLAFVSIPFLYWNLKPPGMFLGDVGSYLLGSFTAGVSLAGLSSGIHPVVVFSPLIIYWADAVYTLVLRVSKKMPVFEAHRMHVYQRLTDYGWSHLTVAMIVAGFTLLAGTLGSLALLDGTIFMVLAVFLLLLCCLVYLYIPTFLSRKMIKG